MRLFQNIFAYPGYLSRLNKLAGKEGSFSSRLNTMVRDGWNGVHLLQPVIEGSTDTFLSCHVDKKLQRAWAHENGMPIGTSDDDILLTQIEHSKAEVFYTQAPYSYGPEFLRRLPGSVRLRVGWHSPPAPIGDISGFDVIVNNFPTSLANYGRQGVRTAYFTPSFDPLMADYCDNVNRPIDIAFVGGYSRHHRSRSHLLEAVAELNRDCNIRFALQRGRLTRLAEIPPFGFLPILSQHARPASVRRVSSPPIFARDMYALFGQTRIVINGSVDLAGGDRGNMRCFEAMGCGALLLTDAGNYPEGMEDGRTIRVYKSVEDAVRIARELLNDDNQCSAIAANGLRLVKTRYSKAAQWQKFTGIIS